MQPSLQDFKVISCKENIDGTILEPSKFNLHNDGAFHVLPAIANPTELVASMLAVAILQHG